MLNVRRLRTVPWEVWAILALAFGLRLLTWWLMPYRLPNIVPVSDEGEYRAAAIWLATGRGFSFFKAWIWTRPPLYVIFLAAHIRLWGPETVWPIRLSQALLDTATVAIVMAWAWLLAPPLLARRVALWAGLLMALSYTLAAHSFLLLSETLFNSVLFGGFLALTWWAQRGGWRWLGSGGVLLGLAALTRGLLVGVLPFVALWVAVAGGRGPDTWRARWRKALLPVCGFTLVVAGLILPWTWWNTRFYGATAPILIDTTGGYNALLGLQPVHQQIDPAPECAKEAQICPEVIDALLLAQPDHGTRQTVAYRTALGWLAKNPVGFVRKAGGEVFDLLLINYGGAERLYRAYAVGETPLPHQLGLLWDDVVYLTVVPLAVIGLFRRQGRAGKGLAVGWLVFNLLTGVVFFAINRFRVPLLPVVFVYAACGLAQWRAPWQAAWQRRGAWFVATPIALLFALSFAWWPSALDAKRSSIAATFGKAWHNRRLAGDCERAWAAIAKGALTEAQTLVTTATSGPADNRLPCFALVQARIWERQNRSDEALALLGKSANNDLGLINARVLMLEGDLRRRRGELLQDWGARGVWASRPVDISNDLGWAWQHLAPPPTTVIEPGKGLDLGLLRGFNERTFDDPADPFGAGYRWTTNQAELRFVAAGTGAAQTLRLHVNGWRPPGEAPAQLTVRLGAAVLATRTVPAAWTSIEVALPAVPVGQDVVVALQSTVFVPAPTSTAWRFRLLGVQLDRAEVLR